MKVLGALVDAGSDDFIRWATSEIESVQFLGVGPTAATMIDLCNRHQPDVVLVGPKFAPEFGRLKTHYRSHQIDEPLWLGLVPMVGDYPRELMRQLGVSTEIKIKDFTELGWSTAIETARRARDKTRSIRVVTAFPTSVPNATLSSMLEPWPEFEVGSNCTSPKELSRAILEEQPQLVALANQHIGDVITARTLLRNAGGTEPRWLLMVSHADPATLVNAVMADVPHMLTSDQFEPVDEFAQMLRTYVLDGVQGESALSRTRQRLRIAHDDDDRKILRLLIDGETNHEIANKVFFSEQTVKNRLSRMMKAANVSNRTELALLIASAATT